MELLVASGIGVLTATGVWLLLRAQTFPVMLGLTLLSYAVNVFIFSMGRLAINTPPVIRDGVERYADPLPQALVLTAIVIAFGMTAVLLAVAVRLNFDSGSDHVDCAVPNAAEPAAGNLDGEVDSVAADGQGRVAGVAAGAREPAVVAGGEGR